jgi:arylsulfatase A
MRLWWLPVVPALAASSVASRPNVVIYFADDLGVGEVNQQSPSWAVIDAIDSAVSPSLVIQTPNLERLARGGTRLLRSYTSSPICGPARFSLMTGMPTGRAPVRGNNLPTASYAMPSETATLPGLLRDAGYATMMVGKWGLGAAPWRFWDRFYGMLTQADAHHMFPAFLWRGEGGVGSKEDLSANNSLASASRCVCRLGQDCLLDPDTGVYQRSARCANANQLFRRQAMQFLDEHVAQRPQVPFLLYWASIAPHAGVYGPGQKLTSATQTSPVSTYGVYAPLLAAGVPAQRVGHMAMITHELDADVGVLLDKLDRLGLADNTVVVFASDNGPHVELDAAYQPTFFHAAWGLRGVKADPWEGGVRSPTIVRWPGRVAAGQVSRVPHAGYDLLLTIAGLCGISGRDTPALEPFAHTGARSVHRQLLDPALPALMPGDPDFMELEICFSAASPRGSGCDLAFYDLRQAPRRMLKAVRYKYAYSLYDVEADPYEKAELNVTNNAELADQLRRLAALNVREPYCPELVRECVAPTPLPTTPSQPSAAPSAEPSKHPTHAPSKHPTRAPAPPEPTPLPSAAPSPAPSRAPSDAPSTPRPSHAPSTPRPSHAPTDEPSARPSPAPTTRPSPAPTARPTRPTATPRPTTLQPTSDAPTLPTIAPTGADGSNETSGGGGGAPGGGAASGAPGTAPPDQASAGLLTAMVLLATCALALAALAFFIAWPVWKRRRAQQRRDATKLASPHPPIDVPEAFEREKPQLPART